MNCRDFREIADTYLSDELLVETNHEVFQHLENCAECRQELSLRREVRQRLRASLINAPEFKLNPVFANKLKSKLKDTALRPNSWLNWKLLTPVLATLLIAISLSFALFYRKSETGFLTEISQKAINRHEDCGLRHFKEWEEQIGKIPAEKISFVKSLQNKDTEILEVHDCEFAGKRFTHYVLERNGKVISVLKTASENAAETNSNKESSIVCEKTQGLQMSSFFAGPELVFVISELSEADNLSIARQLSDSIKA